MKLSPSEDPVRVDDSLTRVLAGARVVVSAADHVHAGMSSRSFAAASGRGYFVPDEEEELWDGYSRYLGVRAALLSVLGDLEDACSPRQGGWERCLPAFVVAFAAACLLLRQARGLAALVRRYPVLRKKLDEASPQLGVPRKTFTSLLRATTDPARLMEFRRAAGFYDSHRAEAAALAELADILELLGREEAWIERRKRDIFRHRLAYRWHSLWRRQRSMWKRSVFGVFKWSGSAVAELRQPGVKPPGAAKRVTADHRDAAMRLARPGDIFVTRHDDALSNLFLPGFWPHAALFVGSPDQPAGQLPADSTAEGARFLEAKKDGVRLRPATETLQVDAFVVLRPPLSPVGISEGVVRAMRHAGKPYDFSFDFRGSERLACTEVIYRGYHGVGGLAFELIETGGRKCLPAEELIAQALAQGFRVVAVCGIGKNEFVAGNRAELLLHSSRTAI